MTNLDAFLASYAQHPHYRSPRGSTLHAQSWQTEAPLRLFLNNLDKEVAENPEELVVYGGTGQAARNPECARAIVKALLSLDLNHSLLIQSGKPVGFVRSHPDAPRVLIANSNLVPHWANWAEFQRLKERGLMMYGQMTAGSWIYIGTQGILQGTYETFSSLARKSYGGSLKGKLVVTAGYGGMGGAQPLAVTLNGGICLGADIDPARLKRRLDSGYLDRIAGNYEEAKRWALEAKATGQALSIGLACHAETLLSNLLKDNIIPDALTDQTAAHDPLNGYVPTELRLDEANALRKSDPTKYLALATKSIARHVNLMLQLQHKGAITFDYGNNIRQVALEEGVANAFHIPGFVPEYIRPLFCEGKGPFRWVALSGDPADILATDEALIQNFPQEKAMIHWLQEAQKKVHFQGLPARICWLGLGQREKAGLIFNDLVKRGVVKAPIVIGRDHLDSGSVASPNRETEAMKDGSDAVSDWPLLNLLSNCSGGATWVSFHHGGGVGMGFSQHAGMVILADGTEQAAERLRRVLYNDPALGVLRHADAGYPEALRCAKEHGLTDYRPSHSKDFDSGSL